LPHILVGVLVVIKVPVVVISIAVVDAPVLAILRWLQIG